MTIFTEEMPDSLNCLTMITVKQWASELFWCFITDRLLLPCISA